LGVVESIINVHAFQTYIMTRIHTTHNNFICSALK
jgi:hypothetical protein